VSEFIISPEMFRAMASQETGEAIIMLIKISHQDLSTPILVTSDAVDTIHLAETYQTFPFRITLPLNTADGPPEMRLEIDNVDRRIIETLRVISGPPTVDLKIVRGSAPDTVEFQALGFVLRDVNADALRVTGRLERRDFTNEPFPAGRFTPALFPGLFK